MTIRRGENIDNRIPKLEKELKAKNRALEIESAVEKVRAQALAMHNSGDLHEVVRTLRNELFGLDLDGVTAVTICLKQDDGRVRLWDITGLETTGRYSWDVTFEMNKIDPRLWVSQIWRAKKKIIATEQDSSDLKRTLKWVSQYDKKMAGELRRLIKVNKIKHGWHRAIKLANGRLITDFINKPPSEIEPILLKMGAAFDLAYKRFLDLKNAEAQAQEAQTEASLEKVRAQAMGMHKPGDLLNVCKVLFVELSSLGFHEMRNAIIHRFNDEKKYFIDYDYSALTGGVITTIPYSDNPVIRRFLKQIRRSDEAFAEITVAGKELGEWKKFRKKGGQPDDPRLDKTAALYYYFYSVGTGDIGISTFSSLDQEKLQLLRRFRNVFEFAYKRYDDIAKAEAQAREAQIEAALERIRARALAMHNSNELIEIPKVLREQMALLGQPELETSVVHLYEEDPDNILSWRAFRTGTDANNEVTYGYTTFPKNSCEFVREWLTNFYSDSNEYTIEISGAKQKEWYKVLFKFAPDVINAMRKTKSLHEKRYHQFSKFSGGALLMVSKQPPSEESVHLQKRAAAVFDLAYRRFLDLKKAEAQAREAMIEAALERVRARGMAMQTSEELGALIGTLFTELTKLDLVLTRCVIWIIDHKTNDAVWWMANSEDPSHPMSYFIPYHQEPPWLAFIKEWKKRTVRWVYDLKGQTKKNWDDYLFTKTGLSKMPKFIKDGMKAPERVLLSASFNNFGGMNVASLEPLSNEHYNILLRFAKVFDLTYTRFNDLKQAEAQAKESRIQLALERIRARTMAMQKSDELPETSYLLFQQLKELGETAAQLSIGIIKEEEGLIELSATIHGSQLLQTYDVAMDEPFVMKKALKAWKAKEKSLVVEFKGKELKDYNNWRNSLLRKKIVFPEEQWIINIVYFSKGFLSFSSDKQIPVETFQLLERFGGVFDQTYTRFLDLQNAEAQSKESKIQLALERVRARTMAMQRSDELMETAAVLFNQLNQLGENIERTIIGVMNEEERVVDVWATRPDGSQMDKMQKFPIDEPILMQKVYAAWQQQKKSVVIDLRGEELESYFQFLKGRSSRLKRESFGKRRVENFAFFSKGILGVINADPETPANIGLYERFAAVFDQTYTRFLDLQTAEAQARESQIQLALERVRARTMAMQKSDELLETSFLLFQQVKELSETAAQVSIGIINEEAGFVELSTTIHGHHLPHTLNVPINDPYVMAKAVAAWKAKRKSLKVEIEGQELKNYNEHRNRFFEAKINFPEDQWIVTIIFFSKGWLSFSSNKNISDETFDLLKRFAAVFEQTYTRFNDLKQAEEQARESQIQLALERVRARTMAMQHSDELQDAAILLFQQIKTLGVETGSCGFNIWEEKKRTATVWMSSPEGGFQNPFNMPHTESAIYKDVYSSMKNGNDFLVKEVSGKALKKHFDYLLTVPVIGDIIKNLREIGYQFPETLIYHFAFFNQGYLSFHTHEPCTDAHDIFKRFAKVFDQTYTRFLDLQKSEAQARESQIQLALERVRARTMAMQRSDELADVALSLSQQVKELGIKAWATGFNIWQADNASYIDWITGPAGDFLEPYTVDLTSHPVFIAIREARQRGDDFFVSVLEGEQIVETYELLNSFADKGQFQKILDSGIPFPTRQFNHFVFGAQVSLLFITYEPCPEGYDIFKRFGKVFEQTYTRFLDLQKAEAQAREAKIETALERVRARTMAMHRSEELAETAQVMFLQLQELGGIPDRISIGVVDEAKGVVNFWTTDQSGSHINNSFTARLTEQTVISKTYDAWKKNERSLVIDLHGDELKEWIQFAREEMGIVVKDEFIKDRRIHNLVFFSHGWILVTTHEPQSPETIQILERFASVFNLTYRRFLDLEKAEAQAREAQIEAALERVRGKAMAMHKSDDLHGAVTIMFEEFQKLNLDVLRCGIGILNKDSRTGAVWATSVSPNGPAVQVSANESFDTHPLMMLIYEYWQKQEDLDYILQGQDLIDYYKAMDASELKLPKSQLFFSDDELQSQYYYAAMFNAGGLYAFRDRPFAAEDRKIMKRFASVVNLTYNRFLDLQKAEAQAKEAKIEAALERVRAKAMAMHKTEDLQSAVAIVFEEMQKLDLGVLRCGISVLNKEKRTGDVWVTSTTEHGSAVQVSGDEAFDIHPLLQGAFDAWLRQEDFYYVLEGDDLTNYYKAVKVARFQLPESQFITSEIEHKRQYCNVAVYHAGGLFAFRDTEFTDEAKKVMKRFANVFDLTYKRFLDLQKAEANAREAQIEASLERVRGKTMAMHNSQDVGDTVATLFDELVKLNVETVRCGIAIIDDSKTMEVWTASSKEDGSVKLIIGQLDMRTHPLFLGVYDAWKNKELVTTYELIGEDLKNYFRAINNSPNYPTRYDIESLPYRQSNTSFMFPEGSLFVFSQEPLITETTQIFKRFAGVFGQTYRRYLDLLKAEAQAREATIEAALEKVRGKAMAMHNSADLSSTVNSFFKELKNLGITPMRCGVGEMHEETQTSDLVFTSADKQGELYELPGKLKHEGHPVVENIYKHWKQQEEYHPILQGTDISAYYRVIKSQMLIPDFPEYTKHYGNYFYFKEGFFFAWGNEEFTEEGLNICRRFTSVLSLTYKRYKDLKQAEASAREAQIEAGLERVRARTMAMHSSDDVSVATATMFTELEKLGIENFRGGITNILPDRTQDVWSVNNLDEGKVVKAVGAFNIDAHPFWQLMYKEWENKKEFLYYFLAGKEKENYVKILSTTQNYLPQSIQQFPDVHFQVYFFGEGAVWTNSLQPHSEDVQQVMKRFTSVFSLTFRRYQDLKKAEAQAREATIEAALEKVRGKAMAMHNSNDLSSTASMVIGELRRLGINPIRCGVGILNKETHKGQLYTATSSAHGDSLSVIGWVLLKGHPVLENIYQKWLDGEDYFPELSGDSMKTYYQQLLAGLSVPLPDFKDGQKHYGHFFSFSVGCLYAWSDVKYNDEEIKILKRFASIIDLTFRRYIELQKSEANAREAVKQAALDRVRAEIASMRTISDLERITPLIWNELKILGIPFIRCGVFLMDDLQQLIHTFLSTPDGRAIAAFHLPYDTPGNLGLVVSNWKDKTKYVGHWNEKEFYQFAEILVREGALDSAENYLKTIPYGGFYLHFLPFLQGMLYVGNTEQLNDEQIELIQHVADAFSTAYARYEDFNKLEAAKQQVEKTLTDLKQAQTQLVQAEKMASLGELTAGIAHEIQNPLNFVNNFSEVSKELLDEMKTELDTGNTKDAKDIADDVIQNLEKINHHGKRADAIVKSMLQHSRSGSGKKEPTDINGLADEYLRLAYHGLRAKDKSFNAKFETEFDNSIGKINIISQDIGRVLVNLINNAFYAVSEKKKQEANGYEPTVTVLTKKTDDKIEIKVKDNGNGIPQKVLDKIFQPFFTTKPTGQGTGLGLSLSYDIITKGHGGELKVETKEKEGTIFIVQLPL